MGDRSSLHCRLPTKIFHNGTFHPSCSPSQFFFSLRDGTAGEEVAEIGPKLLDREEEDERRKGGGGGGASSVISSVPPLTSISLSRPAFTRTARQPAFVNVLKWDQ